jgi:hypothetical protein
MSSGPILITADGGTYRPLGDGGEPVWRRAAQLRAAIETRLGRRHADLFAIPQEQVGGIEWRAPFDGAARAYSALSEAEKRALQSKVQELRPDLERLVERLDSAGRSDGERAFGRLLRQALVAPGSETLFSVDARPVLSFWGFSPEGSAGALLGIAAVGAASAPSWSAPPPPPTQTGWTPAPTSTTPGQPPQAPPASTGWTAAPGTGPGTAAGQAPAGASPPAGTPPYGAPPQMAPPMGAPPPVAVAAAAPAGGSGWWKGMLVALVLLIVLVTSAYFVTPWLPLWAWDGTYPPTARSGGPAGLDDSALRAEREREAALKADAARLWAEFNNKRNQCAPGQQESTVVPRPGETVVVPGGTGPDGKPVEPGTPPRAGETSKPPAEAQRPPDTTTPTPPEAKTPPDAKTPAAPEAKTPPAPKTPSEAKAPGPQKPEPKPPEAKTPPEAKPPADPKADPKTGRQPPQQATRPPDAKPGQRPDDRPLQPVQIPREPGVGFMQGQWRSNTDLTTQGGDDIIRPQYTFDKDGKGKSRIVQKNGVVCEGPAQASRDPSGKLIIRETEALKCSDGTSYAPSTVTCENGRDGRAQCQGQAEGGPTYAVQLGR